MLVNSNKMLRDAKINGYAIPATNIYNLISLKGVLKSAEENDSPIIVSLAEVHLDSFTIEDAAQIVSYYGNKSNQEIVLHFDHGFTKELVIKAIDYGFTSVMIDGSSLSFDENVRLTKEIVEYAHPKNVSVEAEIGHVGGGESYIAPEDDKSDLTTVQDAIKFVELTNVDSLAISIGTAHGEYKGTPYLDFERLEQIAKNVDVPLVLHGGSGSGDENLKKAVKLGICKVNIFTDLCNAAREASKEGYDSKSYYESCLEAIDGIKEKTSHYYKVFNTVRGRI